MKFEAQSVVAVVAIVANFLVTWITLRTQRRGAHVARIWDRKVQTYEELVSYCVRLMKERHEWAAGVRRGPFEADTGHDDADIPMLDRALVYASPAVSAVLPHLDEAETEWRKAYEHWLLVGEGPDSDEAARFLDVVKGRAEMADAVAELVIKVVREELISGSPVRRRWLKGLRYVRHGDDEGAGDRTRK